MAYGFRSKTLLPDRPGLQGRPAQLQAQRDLERTLTMNEADPVEFHRGESAGEEWVDRFLSVTKEESIGAHQIWPILSTELPLTPLFGQPSAVTPRSLGRPALRSRPVNQSRDASPRIPSSWSRRLRRTTRPSSRRHGWARLRRFWSWKER